MKSFQRSGGNLGGISPGTAAGTDDAGGCVSTALISCGILREEVGAALRTEGLHVPTFYLAPAPCIDPRSLERQLLQALRRSQTVADQAIVLIGCCHPDIDALVAQFPARRLAINDCFDALLGSKRKELDREACTFYTIPAWLGHWKRALVKRLGWEDVDARQNFGLYERIMLLDAGVQPFRDEEVLELFDFTGVPVEVVACDLAPLRTLLRQSLANCGRASQSVILSEAKNLPRIERDSSSRSLPLTLTLSGAKGQGKGSSE